MDPNTVFVVLPYLKTTDRTQIRGVLFRSNRDLEGIPDEIAASLTSLCEMFYLCDGVRIEDMVCAYVRLTSNCAVAEKKLRHLYEAHSLIAYLYSSPQQYSDVFLTFEHSSIFVFHAQDVPSPLVWQGTYLEPRVKRLVAAPTVEARNIPGFEGLRNRTVMLWVTAGSRIYPELPHTTLNFSQSLSSDLYQLLHWNHNWALRELYGSEEDFDQLPETRFRVFTGLEWYLRSCRESISEAEAIVDVAIALESLLKIDEGERLTERFKAAVLTLLGPVPRLDWWLDQFYTARSKAVHEGMPNELTFYPLELDALKRKKKGDKKQRARDDQPAPLRPLLDYARRVFRLCLTSILSAASHVQTTNFPKRFVHNDERLTQICKTLSQTDDSPGDRLTAVRAATFDLREYETELMKPDVQAKKVLGVAKLLLQVFMEAKPALPEPAATSVNAFVSDADLTMLEKLARLELIRRQLSQPSGFRGADVVLTFLAYACEARFKLQCFMEERK